MFVFGSSLMFLCATQHNKPLDQVSIFLNWCVRVVSSASLTLADGQCVFETQFIIIFFLNPHVHRHCCCLVFKLMRRGCVARSLSTVIRVSIVNTTTMLSYVLRVRSKRRQMICCKRLNTRPIFIFYYRFSASGTSQEFNSPTNIWPALQQFASRRQQC